MWDAISGFYLDTEPEVEDLERIANVLRSSPYSEAELDHIMFDEVFPVLICNMWSVAGVWTGFDLDSLQSAILKRKNRRLKFPIAMIPGRSIVRDHWRTVKQMVAENPDPRHTT